MKPLVSIISPCYNGEKYISRFLDSVLAQTYNNIELIMINDGSTDNTISVLESYRNKFMVKGFKYYILSQINLGQSAAINKGLKVFAGEYLSWLDSDDAMTPDAIEKKVSYMETHKEVGLVLCKIKVVDFETFQVIGEQKRIPPEGEDLLFFDLLAGKNVFYTPGGFMVRSTMFKDAMPNPLEIEAPKEIGQNFQLVLPIAYKYPIGYIDEFLFFYTVRNDSHSHIKLSFDQKMKIINIADRVLNNIADRLDYNNIKEREKVTRAIKRRKLVSCINTLFEYGRNDNIDTYAESLSLLGSLDRGVKSRILMIKHPTLRYIKSCVSYIKCFSVKK